ncbi:MAG: hypothetical protein IKV23_03210 [Bacteroidaceae bacterium]|nr:hypothetical protein [Bacteroidaceae bacterium]
MKREETKDIQLLLDAMEEPDRFDNEALDRMMTGEGTKEIFSLLSDIETINPDACRNTPDVESEWSNFARWTRMQRRCERKHPSRKVPENSIFIIASIVILLSVFMLVLLIF